MDGQLRKLERPRAPSSDRSTNPLLVSVRSGAKFSMPGMMDTILNLGLNDKTVEGLKARTGNGRFAYDSYRRFIQMFGAVVLEIPKDEFEHEFEAVKHAHGAKSDTELDEDGTEGDGDRYKELVRGEGGKPFPQDPFDQLRGRVTPCSGRGTTRARSSTAASTRFPIPSAPRSTCSRWCSAIQATDRPPASASRATRRPAPTSSSASSSSTHRARMSLPASEPRSPLRELAKVMPKAYKELRTITSRLEKTYKDIQDFEFTIQDEKLYMLQTRSGKRTGYAAVVIATDFVKEKLRTPREALLLVEPGRSSQLLSPVFDPAEWKKIPTATKGLPASPAPRPDRSSLRPTTPSVGTPGQAGDARPEGNRAG